MIPFLAAALSLPRGRGLRLRRGARPLLGRSAPMAFRAITVFAPAGGPAGDGSGGGGKRRDDLPNAHPHGADLQRPAARGPLLEAETRRPVRIRLHKPPDRPTNLHYHESAYFSERNADQRLLERGPGGQPDLDSLPADHRRHFYTHPHRPAAWLIRVPVALGGV